MTFGTFRKAVTRYTHCGQCNIFLYCTDHSAYIPLTFQNQKYMHWLYPVIWGVKVVHIHIYLTIKTLKRWFDGNVIAYIPSGLSTISKCTICSMWPANSSFFQDKNLCSPWLNLCSYILFSKISFPQSHTNISLAMRNYLHIGINKMVCAADKYSGFTITTVLAAFVK